MALELSTLKCPHCGEASGLEQLSLGKYKCKFCGSICLANGENEQSLIVLLTEKQWQDIHDIVKAGGEDASLLGPQIEINKAFPIDLETEIRSLDANSAASIKREIQALSGELASFKDKGKNWNRLAESVLRVIFCRSLVGDFNTVTHIVSDLQECKAVNPRFYVKVFKNYFHSSSLNAKDMNLLLSIANIKESLKDKTGHYDELAFYDFAEFLANSASSEVDYDFYIDFLKATLNDKDFVDDTYPTKKLFLSRTLRKHLKTLDKAYQKFSKLAEGGAN